MQFYTLEQIKKRENSRKRSTRKRLREQQQRRFEFQTQYEKSSREAEKDYREIQDVLRLAQSNSGQGLIRDSRGMTPTPQQKFLLIMHFLAHTRNGDKKSTAPAHVIDDALLLHSYTLALVELKRPNNQALRVFSRSSQLSDLEAIRTWEDLRQRIKEIKSEDQSSIDGFVKQVSGHESPQVAEVVTERLQDQLALFYAQAEELENLMTANPKLTPKNEAFFYHLLLNMGLNSVGIALTIRSLMVLLPLGAMIPLIILSAALLVASATYFNQFKDLSEYLQNWESDETTMQQSFGSVIGLSLEVLDWSALALSTAKVGGKLSSRTFLKHSRKAKGQVKQFLKLFDDEPDVLGRSRFFSTLDKVSSSVKLSQTFFQDVVPELRKISKDYPDASFEILIRGTLTTGVGLVSLTSKKIVKTKSYDTAKLTQSVWDLVNGSSKLQQEFKK